MTGAQSNANLARCKIGNFLFRAKHVTRPLSGHKRPPVSGPPSSIEGEARS
jgi:hypothetical protein